MILPVGDAEGVAAPGEVELMAGRGEAAPGAEGGKGGACH